MATAKTRPKNKYLIGWKTKSNRARCTSAMHFTMILWRSLRNNNVPFPKWTHNSNSFILYISFYGASTSPPAAYSVKNIEGEKKEVLAKLSPLRKGFMICECRFNCRSRRRGSFKLPLPSCQLLHFKFKNLPSLIWRKRYCLRDHVFHLYRGERKLYQDVFVSHRALVVSLLFSSDNNFIFVPCFSSFHWLWPIILFLFLAGKKPSFFGISDCPFDLR